ncbi:hypothetical protein EJ05DRAFT_282635 [Pseudovirgaria hyperparasitica]|uniref:Uncharacterized protein n=1 Tax=Pseudovirgaria hyperparasitica TaxID=470096 RepID=A0A6A6WEB6_9PEZI|nr:uncharacterized protein EJ05DRAFT_282635 [Pseudovirgaria hyperparasitica]KAF2760374.1 hypothetical protein EJ05DRAFT_282635 [Pseudovirgaria hyperparasitica]
MSTLGRALLTTTAIITSTGCYIADWNATHIYNPLWLPHAKFHNAQTMAMGLVLGLLTFYYTHASPSPLLAVKKAAKSRDSTAGHEEEALALSREMRLHQLRFAVVCGSLYWVTQLMAWVYPEVAAVDPPASKWFFPQAGVSAVVLAITAAGWHYEKKAIMGL